MDQFEHLYAAPIGTIARHTQASAEEQRREIVRTFPTDMDISTKPESEVKTCAHGQVTPIRASNAAAGESHPPSVAASDPHDTDFCQWCYDKGLRYHKGPWIHGKGCPNNPVAQPEPETPTSLSDRVRPNSEAAPWVCEEIKMIERQRDEARNELATLEARHVLDTDECERLRAQVKELEQWAQEARSTNKEFGEAMERIALIVNGTGTANNIADRVEAKIHALVKDRDAWKKDAKTPWNYRLSVTTDFPCFHQFECIQGDVGCSERIIVISCEEVDKILAEKIALRADLDAALSREDALRGALRAFADEETCPVSDNCAPGFASGAFTGWGWARNRISEILKALAAPSPNTVAELRAQRDSALDQLKELSEECEQAEAGRVIAESSREKMRETLKSLRIYISAGKCECAVQNEAQEMEPCSNCCALEAIESVLPANQKGGNE